MRSHNSAYSSYDEYLRHPRFRAFANEVIKRAGGICQVCGFAPATEVHHRFYPAWGTFDSRPEFLLPVCHQCHCKIERKDQ